MRTPQKTRKIYEQLRNDILQHKYGRGKMLPKELELAVQLNISVGTLKRALSMLEEEALIRRVRGHGTFVCDTVQHEKIFFLLPCPDKGFLHYKFISSVFQGVLQEAAAHHCHIETLPISPTNDMADIDWSKLFNINAKSRVIICSEWFRNIFPYLRASNCRVAVIHDELKEDMQNEYADWIWLTKEARDISRKMATRFFIHGCKHPAFILRYLKDPRAYIEEDIRSICKEKNPGIEPILEPISDQALTSSEAEKIVCDIISRSPFDGVLVNDSQIFRALRKYKPDIPCGFFDLLESDIRTADQYTFYSEFPMKEMGREAVRLLIQPGNMNIHRKFQAELYDFHEDK